MSFVGEMKFKKFIRHPDRKGVVNYILSYVLCMISIFGAFFLLESFYGFKNIIKDSSIFVLNIFVLMAIFALLYLVCCNVKYSCIGLLVITWLFGLTNYYVQIFRGGPFIASDIFSLATAMNVADSYAIVPDSISISRTLLYFLLVVICLLLPTSKRLLPVNSIIQRILALMVIVFVFWFYFISGKPEKWGMTILDLNYKEVYLKYGSCVAFTLSTKSIFPQAPEGYSVDEVNKIVERYNGFEKKDYFNKGVNIIVVINETYSELDSIGKIETNEDYIPFIRSLNDNVIHGTLVSSIWGGNTANSEYEFLTGNSMAFNPPGSVAFQSLSNELPSIIRVLGKDGYKGLDAYHPGEKSSWNRPQAYSFIGFNDYFYIDLFDEVKMLRNFATDKSLYEQMIKDFEKLSEKDKKPIFEYGLTIQNHGGYEDWDNVSHSIEITDSHIKDEQLELYLNLLKYTDADYKELIDYYSRVDEPTVILFFGDHQPKLSDKVAEYLYNGDEMKKYISPFYLWANYDIDEKDIGPISMNYLGAYLLSETGNAICPYQQFLLDLRKEIPVITAQGYYGADGKHYMMDDNTSPYYEKVREYSFLQYYNMREHSNKLDWFFGI